jgi:Domain of unknown function (DUF4349)
MRLLDQGPMDPDIAEELAAIDATLAGEPVDPRHAELAELALLLRSERPRISEGFASQLDARAAKRFEPAAAPRRTATQRWFSRTWVWAPTATAGALAASVAIVLAIGSSGAGTSGASSTAGAAAGTASTPGIEAPSTASTPSSIKQPSAAGAAATRSNPATPGAAAQSAQSLGAGGLPSPASSRKIVQSSQLVLTSAPNEIDKVAQELYKVLGPVGGIVQSSQVTQTGGLDGNATFQLSIPSSQLSVTMTRLSELPSSHVASRTDSTQDVTNQYNGLTTRLSDARALRTALLKQLGVAFTTQQIDSLKARIHDADAEIASYLGQLAGLGHQINYSQVSVTINAAAVPVTHGSSGFTIGKALHTAGRVLTVAAGVALIGLAGLLPVALVVALLWWIGAAIRRRRREHALDMA